MRRRWFLVAFLLVAIPTLGALVAYVAAEGSWNLAPPRREGPPVLVVHGGKPHLWVLVKQEERRYVARSMSTTRYHFEIRCHDAETAALVWRRRLLTLTHAQQGYNAQARILGPDGDAVWLFVHDQPLAVAAADGTPLVGREQIEARTPAIRGLLSKEQRHYAYDAGLVVTAADARRFRVRAPDYAASAYVPPSEHTFRRITFMATQWNGGHRTKDFQVRQAMFDGRWIGLHTPAEARDAGQDEFGGKLKDPSRVLDEGAAARRTLWTATIAKTRAFSEGRHDRLTDVTPLADPAAAYLQGGFVVGAGTRMPLALAGPAGALVLHRTRIDAAGRLAITRLDDRFAPRWSAPLPIAELANRWELPGRLLLYGSADTLDPNPSRYQEFVVAIDLQDGRLRVWNVTLDAAGGP